jgi:hypothetical protein
MAQHGNTCYASTLDALAAIASQEAGKVVPAGAVTFIIDAAPLAPSSIVYTATPLDGGTPITSTVAVTVPPCALLDWPDALELGWGIGGVWIVVAGLKFLLRGVTNDA